VEHELADPLSILNLYRRLLAFRRATPALQWGSYQAINGVPEACYVFLRQAKDRRILIALNFSSQEQRLALPALGEGAIVISTHLNRAERVNPAQLALRADEGIVVELEPS
jgi:alpha-glucosidase